MLSLLICLSLAAQSLAQDYGQVDLPDQGLMPRYYLGAPRPTLHRRQNRCEEGHHQCVDIGYPDTCCNNDSYCYVHRASSTAHCCDLARNCDETCGSTAYFCGKTTTVEAPTPTTTVLPACCPRACPSRSFYRCAADQGGNCCPYDHACAANSRCVSTQSASKSVDPLVTPLDEGCTTSQHKCDDGEGCCGVSQHCTRSAGTPVCAPGSPELTAMPKETLTSASLSDGAKAGIGAGVAVGASVVTAALTWLYLARRRRRAAADASGLAPSSDDEAHEMVMTPDPRATGLTQDYFGPDPIAGPFTDTQGGSSTPTPRDRGVPAQPHHPEDIAVPVEIDSRTVGGASSPVAPAPVGELEAEVPPETRSRGGLSELYGSEVPELLAASRSPSPHPESPVIPRSPSPLDSP